MKQTDSLCKWDSTGAAAFYKPRARCTVRPLDFGTKGKRYEISSHPPTGLNAGTSKGCHYSLLTSGNVGAHPAGRDVPYENGRDLPWPHPRLKVRGDAPASRVSSLGTHPWLIPHLIILFVIVALTDMGTTLRMGPDLGPNRPRFEGHYYEKDF